ncbi:MAG TPA: hypothetical protein VLF89_05750 [Candidatus Saccharimonadales bacterium]|nr:hypothetical protein [Candidatus Saccharimonadales bacterium]
MNERHISSLNSGNEPQSYIKEWVKTNKAYGPITSIEGTYSPLEKAFFDSTLQPMQASAIKEAAPVSWYRQMGRTCTAWTILNGSHVLGAEFPLEYMSYIHTIAERAGGLELADARKALSRFQVVMGVINARNVLVTSVSMARYMNLLTRENHSIVLSGYQYDPLNQNMNVQLIDPARGVVWVSWKHIANAILPETTHAMFRK